MTRAMARSLALVVGLGWLGATATAISFTPGKSYPVGSNPHFVALGDFNRDGKLDMAVCNYGSNNVSILLGNGDGTFRPAVNYAAGNGPALLVAGDFNNDGILDLATVNLPSGTASSLSILLGNGDGSFQPPFDAKVGSPAGDLPAVADFNRDGNTDLAVPSFEGGGNETVSIYLGNGNGSFQLMGAPYAVGGPVATTVGDYDGNKTLDFAVLEGFVGPTAYLGSGDGIFQPPVTSSISLTNVPLHRLAAADFNRDGKSDLVWVTLIPSRFGFGQPGTWAVTIAFSNGDGTFSISRNYSTGTGTTTCCIVADFNNDGIPDVLAEKAATSTTAASLWLLQNLGDGTFALSSSTVAALPLKDVAGDFDGDGKPDLVVVNSASNSVTPLLTNPPAGLPCTLSTVSPSVTICTPQNNASVTSPVRLIAGATDSNPVVRMEAWVDGVKQVTQVGSTLDTSLTMTEGTHRIAAVAAESDGTYFKQVIYVTVSSPTSAPTVQLTANPGVITAGQSSTLTWTSTNATSVTIQPSGGTYGPSGTLIVQPSATTTYTATATGPGGTATSSATVTVQSATGCVISQVNRTVTICTPADGATVTDPFLVVAGATDTTGTIVRMEVWIDGVKVATQLGSSLHTLASPPPGMHRLVVVAAESSTNYFSSVIHITVSQ